MRSHRRAEEVEQQATPGLDSYVDIKEEFVEFAQKWADARPTPPTQGPLRPRGFTEMTEATPRPRAVIDGEDYHMRPLHLNGSNLEDFHIFDINLYEGAQSRKNIEHYYTLCRDHIDLHVTTSCFTIWRQHKKTNGFAKVIPAIAADDRERDVRVFFFDDNLEWEGEENSPGICNLRDIRTGDYVNFAEGKNGFRSSKAARHTVIHHSTSYRVVLVKANILDAMEDQDYFVSIIRRYALPNEKLIVYMDVNSTIVCNDTVQGKDLANTLLSTMLEFVELRPRAPFEFTFDSHQPVKIEKPKTMKSIVKDMTSSSRDAYGAFWTEEKCWRLYAELADKGEVRWAGEEGHFSLEACKKLFKEYLTSLGQVVSKDGIAVSWFQVFKVLRGHHTVVLNSFGVDTRKVILATVPDEKHVIQVTVNYSLWDDRDVQKFTGQFES